MRHCIQLTAIKAHLDWVGVLADAAVVCADCLPARIDLLWVDTILWV